MDKRIRSLHMKKEVKKKRIETKRRKKNSFALLVSSLCVLCMCVLVSVFFIVSFVFFAIIARRFLSTSPSTSISLSFLHGPFRGNCRFRQIVACAFLIHSSNRFFSSFFFLLISSFSLFISRFVSSTLFRLPLRRPLLQSYLSFFFSFTFFDHFQ